MRKLLIINWLILLCAGTIGYAAVTVFNYSPKAAWLYLERPGDDIRVKLAPGDKYVTSQNDITTISAYLFDNSLSLATFEAQMKKQLGNPSDFAKAMRQLCFSIGMQLQKFYFQQVYSIDMDASGNAYLYAGNFEVTAPFEILATSDLHTTSDSFDNTGMIAKRNAMMATIMDRTRNVQAVIFPGDSAGNYGKKSELDALLNFWVNPLLTPLVARGANLYLGIGNHDTYWNAEYYNSPLNIFQSEPYPTKMMRYLNALYSNNSNSSGYIYTFNLGPVRIINLGLHPSIGTVHGVTSPIPDCAQSLAYLKSILSTARKDQPVIIYFHYPTQSNYSDWWSKLEKDMFYNTIKDYNVLAILVGHYHASTMYKFRNKIPVILAAGPDQSKFIELQFDPSKPTQLGFYFVTTDGKRVVPTINPTQNELDLANGI